MSYSVAQKNDSQRLPLNHLVAPYFLTLFPHRTYSFYRYETALFECLGC
nr:MAG TPA: hypothetical protein [Caudoviricetes sp.]